MILGHTFLDYPHPEKDAVIVYLCGCEHNCYNCQSPELQEFINDTQCYFTAIQKIQDRIRSCKVDSLVISGGDPLHPKNLCLTKTLCRWFKNVEKMNICIYSGYDLEHIKTLKIEGFDYIKGGKYVESLKQLSDKTDDYIQFASSNQFLIDTNYNVVSENGRYDFKKEK